MRREYTTITFKPPTSSIKEITTRPAEENLEETLWTMSLTDRSIFIIIFKGTQAVGFIFVNAAVNSISFVGNYAGKLAPAILSPLNITFTIATVWSNLLSKTIELGDKVAALRLDPNRPFFLNLLWDGPQATVYYNLENKLAEETYTGGSDSSKVKVIASFDDEVDLAIFNDPNNPTPGTNVPEKFVEVANLWQAHYYNSTKKHLELVSRKDIKKYQDDFYKEICDEFEFAAITATASYEPKVIYVAATETKFQYKILGPDGKLKKDHIPWNKLPENFPRSFENLESLQSFLPALLKILSKRGHVNIEKLVIMASYNLTQEEGHELSKVIRFYTKDWFARIAYDWKHESLPYTLFTVFKAVLTFLRLVISKYYPGLVQLLTGIVALSGIENVSEIDSHFLRALLFIINFSIALFGKTIINNSLKGHDTDLEIRKLLERFFHWQPTHIDYMKAFLSTPVSICMLLYTFSASYFYSAAGLVTVFEELNYIFGTSYALSNFVVNLFIAFALITSIPMGIVTNTIPFYRTLVKGIHFPKSANAYDLEWITHPNRKQKALYIDITNDGLDYEVIGLDGELKNGNIPWEKLPQNFPRDAESLQFIKKFLPFILRITAEEGHTPVESMWRIFLWCTFIIACILDSIKFGDNAAFNVAKTWLILMASFAGFEAFSNEHDYMQYVVRYVIAFCVGLLATFFCIYKGGPKFDSAMKVTGTVIDVAKEGISSAVSNCSSLFSRRMRGPLTQDLLEEGLRSHELANRHQPPSGFFDIDIESGNQIPTPKRSTIIPPSNVEDLRDSYDNLNRISFGG